MCNNYGTLLTPSGLCVKRRMMIRHILWPLGDMTGGDLDGRPSSQAQFSRSSDQAANITPNIARYSAAVVYLNLI